MYDSFFKEVINPEYGTGRLDDFLSELLGKKVRILRVLPNDSTRIAAENTLLVTDVVVEFEDGSIANIEIQKIGYMFPEERSACYSADLLLRQYKRIRDEKKKKFSYRDIKPVYTIVLFEHSPKEFQKYKEQYLHYFEPKSSTGLELKLLQKYLFIPLDIFKEKQQNEDISNRTDVYELYQSTERVMYMFSKELQELDKNTVQYMIDEMQDTIDEQKGMIEEQQRLIEELKRHNAELKKGKN